MPWAVAGTVISAGIGASSSRKARKAAEADARANREQAEAARRAGRENMEWFQGEYDRTAPTRQQAVDVAQQTSQDQYGQSQYSMRQALEAEQRRKGMFEPLEDKIVADAMSFSDEARGQELAGQAAADVNRSFSSARGQGMRALASMGVNPNSGAFIGATRNNDLDQALALAGAQTGARRVARDEGYARRMNAVQLGGNLRGVQAQQQQLATGQGNAAVSNAGAAINADQSGAGLRQIGFNGLMQGMGMSNQASNLASGDQSRASAWGERQAAATGQLVGGMVGAGKNIGNTWTSMGRALSGGP